MKLKYGKFQKKPIVVTAFQWKPEMGEVGGVVWGWAPDGHFKEYGVWTESKNWQKVNRGDYIVTGMQGDIYAVNERTFEAEYSTVEDLPCEASVTWNYHDVARTLKALVLGRTDIIYIGHTDENGGHMSLSPNGARQLIRDLQAKLTELEEEVSEGDAE
ncbi:hypothetical protein D3C74_49380 [compost metagenome]